MNTTRALIIEEGVTLESVITQILGLVLDISPSNSKILGIGGHGLSFKSKIDLLSEMNITPPDVKSDLQLFYELRNKFAHVKEIDSFSKYFEIQKIKPSKQFLSYSKNYDGSSEEDKFKFSYKGLIENIKKFLTLAIEKLRIALRSKIKLGSLVNGIQDYKYDSVTATHFIDAIKNQVKEIPRDGEYFNWSEQISLD